MTDHSIHVLTPSKATRAMSGCDRNTGRKMIDMEKKLETLRKELKAGLFMNGVAKRLRPKPRERDQVKAEVKVTWDHLALSLNLIPKAPDEDRPL
jgi:hypothetical protein